MGKRFVPLYILFVFLVSAFASCSGEGQLPEALVYTSWQKCEVIDGMYFLKASNPSEIDVETKGNKVIIMGTTEDKEYKVSRVVTKTHEPYNYVVSRYEVYLQNADFYYDVEVINAEFKLYKWVCVENGNRLEEDERSFILVDRWNSHVLMKHGTRLPTALFRKTFYQLNETDGEYWLPYDYKTCPLVFEENTMTTVSNVSEVRELDTVVPDAEWVLLFGIGQDISYHIECIDPIRKIYKCTSSLPDDRYEVDYYPHTFIIEASGIDHSSKNLGKADITHFPIHSGVEGIDIMAPIYSSPIEHIPQRFMPRYSMSRDKGPQPGQFPELPQLPYSPPVQYKKEDMTEVGDIDKFLKYRFSKENVEPAKVFEADFDGDGWVDKIAVMAMVLEAQKPQNFSNHYLQLFVQRENGIYNLVVDISLSMWANTYVQDVRLAANGEMQLVLRDDKNQRSHVLCYVYDKERKDWQLERVDEIDSDGNIKLDCPRTVIDLWLTKQSGMTPISYDDYYDE